jgi:BirA family transcriptional regulator, biotin operon repressor / biotin---[acetyl-CoA-carboxylase] ligase
VISPTATISRLERFERIGSTNDVVRDWLAAGTPEICVAAAEEQHAGRGRSGRSWVAPRGAALLVSVGFRPTWLAPEHVWRLAACVSLAMADAAEDAVQLPRGTVRLKWPNDLVALVGDAPGEVRKLGGVLGESSGLGTDDPTVIVGLGLNAAWHPLRFPDELRATMTSLHELSGGMPVDRDAILEAALDGVAGRIDRLRAGRFDAEAWADRQVTTGRTIALETDDGPAIVAAIGVDPESGALLVGDVTAPRSVLVGDIRHVRLGGV